MDAGDRHMDMSHSVKGQTLFVAGVPKCSYTVHTYCEVFAWVITRFCSEFIHPVVLQMDTEVLEKHVISIFRRCCPLTEVVYI
jgi:hypothetical protein